MYKINDKVVYKRNVCIIEDIAINKFSKKECYILKPVDDDSLKITVPLELEGEIRNVISKEEVEKIISNMPNIEVIKPVNEKNIENDYKKCLDEFSHENLIKVIKTTYLRNKTRTDSKKKISDKDDRYFKMSEHFLYTEFKVALNMSYEEAKEYVENSINKESSDSNETNK